MKATRRIRLSVIAALLVFPLASRAGDLVITPTTTLAAETSNNTSAAGGFVAQSNGNLGAGNVSKLDIHSLLYPGAQTKVFAHLVLWFGKPSHINIGYSSTSTTVWNGMPPSLKAPPPPLPPAPPATPA